MPRRLRFELPGVPLHVVQRGNDRQRTFADDADRRSFLDLALRFSERREVAVHAYVLMDNHVHFLLGATIPGAISRFMHDLGVTYVGRFNERHGRTGTLWEGRFKSCLVDSRSYLWNCHRYIEFNPVRASMCATPEQFRWSSYASNALGRRDPLVTPRPEYLALGKDSAERRQAYRRFVAMEGDDEFVSHRLRNATTLGGERFEQLAKVTLGEAVLPRTRGRPRTKR